MRKSTPPSPSLSPLAVFDFGCTVSHRLRTHGEATATLRQHYLQQIPALFAYPLICLTVIYNFATVPCKCATLVILIVCSFQNDLHLRFRGVLKLIAKNGLASTTMNVPVSYTAFR
uniref:Transmembrane protein n=1 Tax=Ascaris lumbricoides TaxID=6252 RepID=A0A0M3HNY7_ASCLU